MTSPSPRPPLVELMPPEALVEARAFNEHLERILAVVPSVHQVPIAAVRRARREGKSFWPPLVFLPGARTLSVPGRAGPIGIRVIDPPGGAPSRGVYLHFHGGGWALGAADMQDPQLAELAAATGLTAVSVEYRLAPEHPFPAGPDDCEDAALWLLDRGQAEIGAPGPVFLGGESAGAHLAVMTLLRLRDRGIGGAVRGANLVYGTYDLGSTPSARRWGDRNLILSGPIMDFFMDAFLPGMDPESRRSPDRSPLYADLHGLPPAIFTAAALDPLLDDSLFMDARWRAAGLRAELRVWPEAIHGFTAFPLAVARAANAAQYAFLNAEIAATS